MLLVSRNLPNQKEPLAREDPISGAKFMLLNLLCRSRHYGILKRHYESDTFPEFCYMC